MTQVEITVRGSNTAYAPPERGTVKVSVGFEGPEPGPVYDSLVDVTTTVRRSIESMHNPTDGPVTWWSSGRLRTWANRPWNDKGKQLPLVHHAGASFEVKFSDFERLSAWVTEMADLRGISVDGIAWALTEVLKEHLIREVRAAAVRDAIEKAKTYSDAMGAGRVRVTALADAGMLGEGLHPTVAPQASYARMAAASPGGGDVEFSPNDIAVSVDVDVRLIAGA